MRLGFDKTPRTLIACVALLVLAAGTCMWWVLRDDDVVLFDGLDATRLNAISTDLDRADIEYRVDRESGVIAVAPADSQRARRIIMSSGNAFREAVGFELFNKSDFGMTDFAQKINYQRALEGEVARTISALEEIKYARVHLVLPEHGLFRAQKQQARAAITVFPEDSRVLQPEQIRGIQRIAASAVPELDDANVTVVDESGVVLSTTPMDGEQATSGARLAQKQAVERYLSDKIRVVLTRALGAERFAVSVDATLELNQRTTTTERVLDGSAGGGIKRIKETARNAGGEGDAGNEDHLKEVEYVLGHETEQVVHGAGGIRRIQVGVIVDRDLANVDVEQLRELIAATVGADSSRGDKVAVVQHGVAVQRALEQVEAVQANVPAPVIAERSPAPLTSRFTWIGLGAIGALLLAIASLAVVRQASRRRELLRQRELRQQLRLWAERDAVVMEPVQVEAT